MSLTIPARSPNVGYTTQSLYMQDKVGDGLVFDFGSVPPEITSEQIYMGPGDESLMTAAAAWQQVATDLESSAAAYNSVLQQLTEVWQGPGATAMVTAGMPYVWWLQDIAQRAAQLGIQAQAAATAFQVAHATVVPPPVIAANRTQWATLVATNLFGHNGPAIAANEAHYAEMWAQDVAAMSQYSASSQAAVSAISPFTTAPVTSRSGATSTAPAAVTSTGATKAAVANPSASAVAGDGLLSTQTLTELATPYVQSLVSSGAPINLLTMLATFTGYNALAEATRGNKPPMVPGPGGPSARNWPRIWCCGPRWNTGWNTSSGHRGRSATSWPPSFPAGRRCGCHRRRSTSPCMSRAAGPCAATWPLTCAPAGQPAAPAAPPASRRELATSKTPSASANGHLKSPTGPSPGTGKAT